MASTLLACRYRATHWELFGISFPVVRSISIDPGAMQLSWYDGCNHKWTSLRTPLTGVVSLAVGSVVTVHGLILSVMDR